jgi:hypothetical protein
MGEITKGALAKQPEEEYQLPEQLKEKLKSVKRDLRIKYGIQQPEK